MGKKYISLVVLFLSMMILNSCADNKTPSDEVPVVPNDEVVSDTNERTNTSPLSTMYTIDGEEVTLEDGKSEKEIVPGAASKEIISVFSYDTVADVNDDGMLDTVVLLTKNSGGSGIFYYLAVAMNSNTGFQGSNAILIGDRIAPDTTEFRDGKITVNYMKRLPWESFADQASVGASKSATITNGILEEIQGEILSNEITKELISEKTGDCVKNECEALEVQTLDGEDGIWYVEAVYTGLQDDSMSATKTIYRAHFNNEKWELGTELKKEFKCQKGRGSEEFSEDFCI